LRRRHIETLFAYTTLFRSRVGDEGLREGTAVLRLQDRRLDFDEVLAVEVRTNRRDHPRAHQHVAARVLVHQQVEVASAIASLGVDRKSTRLNSSHQIISYA